MIRAKDTDVAIKTVNAVSVKCFGKDSPGKIVWRRPGKGQASVVAVDVIGETPWQRVLGSSGSLDSDKAEESLFNALNKVGMYYEPDGFDVMLIYRK